MQTLNQISGAPSKITLLPRKGPFWPILYEDLRCKTDMRRFDMADRIYFRAQYWRFYALCCSDRLATTIYAARNLLVVFGVSESWSHTERFSGFIPRYGAGSFFMSAPYAGIHWELIVFRVTCNLIAWLLLEMNDTTSWSSTRWTIASGAQWS